MLSTLTSRQKLKVTELKELLSKHNLPQTGKKDELVKRLVENNIDPDVAGTTDQPVRHLRHESARPS